ncbi:cytochrome C and Quinol oxidase polypeptide I [bacterium BMS3Bbin12]|nr:cytochrome C and Quinol oxidase polypeptide I [bacterium BMS3Abin12]GBE47238.1 cytochrome C and Quinol oxidase polypeptide I [bacterium BMS3Bbin12]GBE49653.1 cytochrome C and Quinol oxidase polypeptide I [bacterium BMS3Bbin13]
MASPDTSLPVVDGLPRRLAIGWLSLGLCALGISSLFAVLLVMLRTPYLRDLFHRRELFPATLVLHVDLAVLVWFLSLAGVLWSLLGDARLPRLGWTALGFAVVGALGMVAALLLGVGHPLMSNYIPVLDGPVFLTGLGLLAAGCALMVLRTLVLGPGLTTPAHRGGVLRFGAYCAAIAIAMAMFTLIRDYHGLPDVKMGREYFGRLFWGGGHLFQFANTLLMLVTWLVLVGDIGARVRVRRSVLISLFGLEVAPVFLVVLVPALADVNSDHYRFAFTQLMRWGIWPVAVIFMIFVLYALYRTERGAGPRPAGATLLRFSILLFCVGLVLGALIRTNDVMVPAHYHGTDGAVTLAFMGLTYHLLGRLGFATVPERAIRLQARLYGGGMLTLVAGLAWSGLYGVERKEAGSLQVFTNVQEFAGMLLMAAGAVVALVATWYFLALVLPALFPSLARHRAVPRTGHAPRS